MRFSRPLMLDAGLLVIRAWIGLIGLFHGSQKLFGLFGGKGPRGFAESLAGMNIPMPLASAYAAGSAEFFGGALVMLGLFSRIAALPFLFTMLVAYFVAHGGKFAIQHGGGEYPLTLAIVLLGIVLTGPGRFAITRKL